MTGAAGLLAHQGGWDETLLVLAPLSLFALLLYVANRRASRLGDPHPDHDEQPDEPPDGR